MRRNRLTQALTASSKERREHIFKTTHGILHRKIIARRKQRLKQIRREKMETPKANIPILPLEPPPPTQGSISAPHGYSSHGTSCEDVNNAITIDNDSQNHPGAHLSLFSIDEDSAALEATPSSPKNFFQTMWGWCRCRLPEGWRFGATIGAILSYCVLIGNIIIFVVASASVDSKDGQASTFAAIHKGDCSDIEHIQLGIHLIINIFSTLLLGASNYCMQCLSAPTREEVNKAHKRGRYLDIGIPSLTNLRFIKGERLICWILLGLSSLPLHLIYNSTFFVSITNNSYDIYFSSHDFENGAFFDKDLFTDVLSHDSYDGWTRNSTIHRPDGSIFVYPGSYVYSTRPSVIQERAQRLGLQQNGSVFERLENGDCIEAYAKQLLSNRLTLVLVSSTTPRNNSQVSHRVVIDRTDAGQYISNGSDNSTMGNCSTSAGLPLLGPPNLFSCLANSSLYTVISYHGTLLPERFPIQSNWFSWICSQSNSYDQEDENSKSLDSIHLCSDGYWQTMKSNASSWTVYGFEIDYCISERLEDACKLSMGGCLLLVVIVFNAIKAITITFVVWKSHDEHLITIGDAAASFIKIPDPVTKGLCLYTRENFHYSYSGICGCCSKPKPFKSEAIRSATGASRRRWVASIILILCGLGVSLGLLGYGINDLQTNYGRGGFQFLWGLGLGTMNALTLIRGWSLPTSGNAAIISAVLVANSPQALFSMLYLLINSVFTSISLAAEWSRYGNRSTSLRVSKPRGSQRSTYFLQVPYRLAIPLMVLSTFLHWIMSQSIFFSQVYERDATGALTEDSERYSLISCSYSPLGIILTAIAIFVLLIFAMSLGWRKLNSGIPLAGGCSAAISAACHSPEGTSELLPVMWGVIPDVNDETEDGEQVGHCAFSNGSVEPPVEGHLYA